MKAMILAAGLGTRMRPLTDHTPKPLLRAGGKALIDYHLARLEHLGVSDVAINTHWLAEQVQAHIQATWAQGLNIEMFHEARLLETAGGIANALSLLDSPNDAPFLLINGDIFFDADIQLEVQNAALKEQQARLFLIDNPSHNPLGDFSFEGASGLLTASKPTNSHTYSGIGLYRPSLFRELTPEPHPLGPILKSLAEKRTLGGLSLEGYWLDVGTPERLETLKAHLSKS